MDANIYIKSELVDGAIIHPTLPMSYLGEVIDIPSNNYDSEWNYAFSTLNEYREPFFIYVGKSRAFYYKVSGTGSNFSIYFMRTFTMAEGRYKFYTGEKNTNAITLPMTENGKLYVGGERG